MRILVTGSSGFIGRFLVPRLLARGHDLVGLDLRVGPDFGGRFRFVQGDIGNAARVDEALEERSDLIIHLAAEHKDFGIEEGQYYKVNVEGTKNILSCATRLGVRKFMFFSSVAVYGDSAVPTYEGTSAAPTLPYGRTKLLAEQALREWAEDCDREVVMIRPTVVFGPFNLANMYRLIEAVARRRYVRVGDGRNVKSVAYVENLVGATVFLIERMKTGVEVYNYADSPHLTTNHLIECIARCLGVRVPELRIPKLLALMCALPLDVVAKATGRDVPLTAKRIHKFTSVTHHLAERIREVGYQPPYALEEGIRRTVDWYLTCGRRSDVGS